MQISQHKFILRITERTLNIANDRVDFTSHNYCVYCRRVYQKDYETCLRCNRKLQTERTDFIQCRQCDTRMYAGDYCCSRKQKKRGRYSCIPCGLKIGVITQADLDEYIARKNIEQQMLCRA